MSELTATQRFYLQGRFGRRLAPEELKPGLLVRYDAGCTALATLESPHAGGWHGRQCMGGVTFVHDNGWSHRIHEATPLDQEIWNECAKWRKP